MYLVVLHAGSAECGLKRFASKIDQGIYQEQPRIIVKISHRPIETSFN